jgi:DNA repair exonuclease SbcCD ATPase subunit
LTERNKKKSELEKGLQLQEKQMTKLSEKVVEKNLINNKIILEQKMIHEIDSQVNATNKYVKKLRSDIDSIQSDTKNIDEEQAKLKEMGQAGKELVENKLKLNDDMHYYSLASFLMKDTGIKSKIIKYYLPIMNKIINKYLAQMDFFVQFELNDSFEETIKSRHRDIFTYDSFSEGEKRKIDLSLLFAWRAVAQLKNSLNCNLLIFDEVLDGSLDDVATESFLSILKGLDKGTNIFVISHKSKELLQDKFQDHITFVKRNNFSKIDQ